MGINFQKIPKPILIFEYKNSDLILKNYNRFAQKQIPIDIESLLNKPIQKFLEITQSQYNDLLYFKDSADNGYNNMIFSLKNHDFLSYHSKYTSLSKNQLVIFIEDKIPLINDNLENIQFSSFKDNIKINVTVLDKKGNYVYLNDHAAHNLGGKPENFTGKSPYDIFPREDADKILNINNRTVQNKESLTFKEVYDLPKGRRTHLVNVHPLADFDMKSDFVQWISIDITPLRDMKNELTESEKKFKNLFEYSPYSILLIDFDWNIVDCNSTINEVLGFSKEEVIGKNLVELGLIDNNLIDKLIERTEKLKRGENLQSIEMKVNKKNKEKIWIKSKPNLVGIEGKDLIQLIGQDITESKLIRKKYKDLFNYMSSGVAVYESVNNGKDFIFKDFNKSAEKLSDIKKEEVLGKSVSKMFPAVIDSGLLDAFRKVWKTGEPIDFPTFYYNDNRIMQWVKNYIYKLPTGEIVAVYDDVSAWKETEFKLMESEKRFRMLYENIPGGVFIVDEYQRIKDVNEKTLNLTGFTKEEIIGESCEILCPKASNSEKCGMLEKADKVYESIDSQIFTNSGEEIPILKYLKKITLNGEEHILENFLDISEKKKIEKRLKDLNIMKSELLSRTSHELKTPLVAIKGFSSLLLELFPNKLNDEMVEIIEEILKGCERLEVLIKDIIKTSSLETNQIKLNKKKEDIISVIDASVEEHLSLIKLRSHELILNLPDKLIISFDKKQIKEVIDNLLVNAIKFTPPKGKIRIETEIKKDNLIVLIKDTGIGISSKEKKRLFTQFGKIERYGKGWNVDIEGSGLGLFISKRIAELHQGSLWVESKGHDQGSTFKLSLPRN